MRLASLSTPLTRPALGLAILLGLALPATAQQTVENEIAKVFNGSWFQSKEADKNGLLSYLTQERAAKGEYFSIRCEPDGTRSVRVSFPEKLPAVEGRTPRGDKPYVARAVFQIDDLQGAYLLDYTGPTEDAQILKGTFHSYRVQFPSAKAESDFLTVLRRGNWLNIQGQSLPVDLTGAGAAIGEQAGYCG